jgi:hypothetical protein
MPELIKILYQDEWLVAASKPSGLLVHRSYESSDRKFLLQLLRDQLGGNWLYPLHRLDRAAAIGFIPYIVSIGRPLVLFSLPVHRMLPQNSKKV